MDASNQQIAAYDPAWITSYQTEIEKLKPVFGDSFVAIEHIGSTSIPELASKPIIDIAVLIDAHEKADQFVESLEELGYMFDKDLHAKTQFPERHFFRKGNPPRFHLSIAYADKAKFWQRQILFRDWLRNHAGDREEYEQLKKKLIAEDPTGGNTYIGGKTPFIQEILLRAGFGGIKEGK